LAHLKLKEVFLLASGAGLIFNIFTSYANVLQEQRKRKSSLSAPLFRLTPFLISASLHLLWLSAPSIERSFIVHSPLLLPCMISWGLQFAHQVGRLILAHVTNQPYPFWDPIWIWMAVAAVDIHSLKLFGIAPHFLKSFEDFRIATILTLLVSLLLYGRFVMLVINDITNFLGIACFTVRKKDESGHWRKAKVVDHRKKS